MLRKKQISLYPVYPGVINQLLALNFKVYELPKEEGNTLANESYLEIGNAKHYLIFNRNLVKTSITKEEPLHIADAKAKEAMTNAILQSIANAYMTGYQQKPELVNGVIDVTLNTQKLRIVYLPSTALLTIIALEGGIIT